LRGGPPLDFLVHQHADVLVLFTIAPEQVLSHLIPTSPLDPVNPEHRPVIHATDQPAFNGKTVARAPSRSDRSQIRFVPDHRRGRHPAVPVCQQQPWPSIVLTLIRKEDAARGTGELHAPDARIANVNPPTGCVVGQSDVRSECWRRSRRHRGDYQAGSPVQRMFSFPFLSVLFRIERFGRRTAFGSSA
jgi:hypothetical protein